MTPRKSRKKIPMFFKNDLCLFVSTPARTALTRDFARRRKTEVTFLRFGDFLADPPSDEAPPEDRIEYDRKSRLLGAAIDALPPRCREVFELCVDDVPVSEIARRLSISDRMVRKHLSLAMRLCRAALD